MFDLSARGARAPGRDPHLIAEFAHSYFVVGDHQWHRGYALVALKEHVREPFDAPREHLDEVLRAARALHVTFRPPKLNYSCYGNAEPHVHWHLVPRYDGAPADPWKDSDRFAEKTISADDARELAGHIRRNLV